MAGPVESMPSPPPELAWQALILRLVIGGGLFGVFVAPPEAIRNLGLTVQALSAVQLGSRRTDFVRYEMRRAALTVCYHAAFVAAVMISCLAAGGVSVQQVLSAMVLQPVMTTDVVALAAFAWAAVASAATVFWGYYIFCSLDKHWIAAQLRLYDRDWEGLANRISLQMELALPIEGGTEGFGVYVTRTWLLSSTAYNLRVALQSEIDVAVVRTVSIPDPSIGPAGPPTQVLTVQATSTRPGMSPFTFKMYAGELENLRSKLSRGVRVAAHVEVQQSPDQQFMGELANIIRANTVRLGSVAAEHKSRMVVGPEERAALCIRRTCDVDNAASLCGSCTCRPFWCFPCLNRYFVSRQDPRVPSQWAHGTASCPSCHAVFCVRDIVSAERSDSV